MNKAKKDYMAPDKLNKAILEAFRGGLTVKQVAKKFASTTIEHDNAPLPKGYVEWVIYEEQMKPGYWSV